MSNLNKSVFLMKTEDIIVSVFLLIVFSFQFHVIWLLYDVLAIWAIYFFLKNTSFILLIKIISSFAFFLFLSLKSGSHLISFFSIWDNGKHLFVIYLLFKLIDRYEIFRNIRFIDHLGLAMSVVFLIKMILVPFQYFSGYHMDDVSGTFGYGGSHSLGYFCLLYIAYLLYMKKSVFLTIFISIICFIFNYMAENMGFYLLFILIMSFNFFSFRRFKYFIFFGVLLICGIVSLDFILKGDLIAPMIYRFSELANFFNFDENNIRASRGFLTAYSIFLGGLFGKGPGAYSEIYSLFGWLVKTLDHHNLQIKM